MLENLENLDQKLFLVLNHFSSPGFDPVMSFLSGHFPWILFLLTFLFALWKKFRGTQSTQLYWFILLLILVIAATDLVSVHGFKEVFHRLRPCHEPSLAGEVRLINGHCGGQYGFVSSHATNSFGLAVLSALLLKKKWFTLSVLFWAAAISYSRIYVGVHYPGDVLGGALLGLFIGSIFYISFNILSKRLKVVSVN
jgi:undecaprenyl-diphosphatase